MIPPFVIIGIIALGLIPSFSWLFFYLKKDEHPEPKYLIAQTFLLGMISAPFVVAFEVLPTYLFTSGAVSQALLSSPAFLFWAAFVEEAFKFLIIWIFILNNPEFDEPVDAMIYLIVAGLGFAAMENILFLFKVYPQGISSTIAVWGLRFVGATFLHSLAAAITGYFVALAWFYYHHAYKLIALGLFLATIFHLAFNLFILQSSSQGVSALYSYALLIVLAIIVSTLFHKIWFRQHNETIG